jgi:hypothetical protein
VVGNRFVVPQEFQGENIVVNVYDLKGKLVKKIRGKCPANTLLISNGAANEVRIVKLKATD